MTEINKQRRIGSAGVFQLEKRTEQFLRKVTERVRHYSIMESLLFFFLLVFFLSASSSVAYSEIALGVVVLLWAVRAFQRRGWGNQINEIPNARKLYLPIILWIVATGIVVLFARDVRESAVKLPKLLPLALVYLLSSLLFTEKRLRYVSCSLILGGGITSLYGIIRYIDDPSSRLRGFIGSYMTTAGILMMISLVAFALLSTGGLGRIQKRITWITIPIIVAALIMTGTRGSWIGLLMGVALLIFFENKRLTLLAVILVALLLIPERTREAAFSSFNPNHPRNRERVFMWKAGLKIFRDHPLTGVGLSTLRDTYIKYRDPESEEIVGHLHSVPIHILASMGLVGFLAWIYLFASLLIWQVRALFIMKNAPPFPRGLLLGGLAALAAFLVNGLFEWNLGDIEVGTLLWSVVGLSVAAVSAAGRGSLDIHGGPHCP